jgi:hypothetical protein
MILSVCGTALAGSTGPNVDWLYVVMMVSRPASLGPNIAVTQRTQALGVPLQYVIFEFSC